MIYLLGNFGGDFVCSPFIPFHGIVVLKILIPGSRRAISFIIVCLYRVQDCCLLGWSDCMHGLLWGGGVRFLQDNPRSLQCISIYRPCISTVASLYHPALSIPLPSSITSISPGIILSPPSIHPSTFTSLDPISPP